jgi:hypothetical protein
VASLWRSWLWHSGFNRLKQRGLSTCAVTFPLAEDAHVSKRVLSETILHVELSSPKKTALLTSNGGIYRTPYAHIENANYKKNPTKPTKLYHHMMILRLSLRPLLQEYVPINIGGKAAVKRRLWRYDRHMGSSHSIVPKFLIS